MEHEKRKAERFRINQLIGYYPNREEYLWAEGVEISAGGMRCTCKDALDPLTNVYLMVGLPGPQGERLLHIEGYVAWSSMEEGRCLFGVSFQNMGEEDKRLLEEYLANLSEGIVGVAVTPT
jgi:c-di-GMP-binding flagellar brake protein YcgR